jgi:hypothetical protein
MAALTWLPTTMMPEVGHIWTADDTTCCDCHGTPTDTALMRGKCVVCISVYGQDVADANREVKWFTRGSAPLRHGFRPDQLKRTHARPVCGFQPLTVAWLYESDHVIRCPKCVETLRTGPPPADPEPDHDHQI